MNKNSYGIAYELLKKVFSEDAYITVLLDDTDLGAEKGFITRLVCGTLERNTEFEYVIGLLCEKRPKMPIRIILKIGMFLIKYCDSVPDYAAVNEMAELTKAIGKGANAGFVNSVLRAFSTQKIALPKDKLEAWSVQYSVPLWVCERYVKEYGDGAEAMLSGGKNMTHIRANARKFSTEELYSFLNNNHISYIKSENGAYIGKTSDVGVLLNKGKVFVQANGSVEICKLLANGFNRTANYKILDLCAAPGGKSVLLSELFPCSLVLAAELYPQRTAMIRKYASKAGADNITALTSDGCVFREKWIEDFDLVLVDAPCSGLGVIGANPDTYIHRKAADIDAMIPVQHKLLSNAAAYLKKGGALVYSTCTTLREENEDVTGALLADSQFRKVSEANVYSEFSGERFYMCRIEKL